MCYKNLVLSGGSVKGFSYIGALKAMEEENIIGDIKRFVGTSIGAVFATLFGMGFTSIELDEYMKFDIEELYDINIDNLYDGYGIWSGEEAMNIVRKIIEKKYKTDITFKELYEKRKNEIIICVTNLSEYKIEYLSYKKYPNMKIIDAIRYAITIPFIFTSQKYKDKIFIDGAVIENISFMNLKPEETLGIMLVEDICKRKKCDINCLEDYIKNLLICMNKNYLTKYDNKYNVIEIVCNNIDILDFNIDIVKKQELRDCGYKSVIYYLKKFK